MSSPAPQIRYVRRRSLAGPIILIAIGTLFLLGNFHILTWRALMHQWARYWPLLIIVWGLIKLVEHWQDNRDGVPSRGIGVGGVFLLIFVILLGSAATTAEHNWNTITKEMDVDSDFADLFGNSYTFSNTLEQPFAPGSSLRVVDDRGEVTISAWDEPKLKVVVSKTLRATSEEDSRKFDQQTQPQFTVADNVITLNANTGGAGNQAVRCDLQIYVPRIAAVDVSSRRGGVSVETRTGAVKISTSRGDATVKAIDGSVTMDVRRGSVRAHEITGDVSVDGRIDDTTIGEVKGKLRLTGDYFGQMTLNNIAKGVAFHSSRTDMELAALPGELSIESGELRGKNIAGPMSVTTRSKEIRLENVSGDLKIENSNGPVIYQAGSKLGQVDITNSRADVQLMLPPQASFQLEARARRGDIATDFSIPVQTDRQEQTASGAVGKGGPQLRVVNNHGGIEIRKAVAGSPPSAEPGREESPSGTPPKPPKAPKAPKPPKGTATTSLGLPLAHGDSVLIVPAGAVLRETPPRRCYLRGAI